MGETPASVLLPSSGGRGPHTSLTSFIRIHSGGAFLVGLFGNSC